MNYCVSSHEIYRVYKNRLYNRWLMQGNQVRSPASMSKLEREANKLTERYVKIYKIK